MTKIVEGFTRSKKVGGPVNTESIWNGRKALTSVILSVLLEIVTDFNRRNEEILGKTKTITQQFSDLPSHYDSVQISQYQISIGSYQYIVWF